MKWFYLILFGFTLSSSSAQSRLKPGFDAKEYADLLSLAYFGSSIPDSTLRLSSTDPYKMLYRSPEMGLKNRWTLYLRPDNIATIDLRGTINQTASWLANFYAAMIPATGELEINDSTRFTYELARDPKAMVHVGWTISIAHLAPDIIKQIKKHYASDNLKEYIIFGHSQGGALAFLLRSHLEYAKRTGLIPSDIFFKTYSSAGPKPGNMYYSYEYDFITRGGWGFNVVNSADWVPETPFSIQTFKDINPTNPLIHTKRLLRQQKLLIRVAGGMLYNKLQRTPRKAQKKLEKYLGTVIYKKAVIKILPQLKQPEYAHGNNYMRAGTPIILLTDKEYYERFPESEKQFFIHHSYKAYSFLLNKCYP